MDMVWLKTPSWAYIDVEFTLWLNTGQNDTASHWLGANLESSLKYVEIVSTLANITSFPHNRNVSCITKTIRTNMES